MIIEIEAFLKTEWDYFKSSKTVKALIAIEAGAISMFAYNVIAGTQPLTMEGIKGWALVQAGIILAALNRHAQAGIEAKLDGQVDPGTIKAVEEVAQAKLVAVVKAKAPELGAALEAHINDAEPVIADVPVVVVKKPEAIG